MPENDDSDGDDEGVVVVCKHCGNEWVYTGDYWTTTCTNCQRKTETGLKPDEFDEE